MTLEQITAFFGWMTVINMGLMTFAALFVAFARDWMMGTHANLLGVERERLPGLYFSYLGNFKIAILTLNLVPWLALKLIG